MERGFHFDTKVEDRCSGHCGTTVGRPDSRPVAGQSAIDKGKVSAGVSFDQRDFARVVGSKPDIGAVEFDPDRIFGNGFNL
jgi:hypothetical protein